MSAHLRFDVSVDRTVEVLRIQIERELLPLKKGTPPGARIVEPCLAGRVQGGVHVAIVVDAFGQILEEIGAKVLHPAGVVDNQWNVLQVSKAPGINSGVPSEDEGVRPLAFGMGHPLRRGAKVHRFLIEPSTIREGCGAEIVREFIPRADHRGESRLRVKPPPMGRMPSRHGRSSGFHATREPSSSESRRSISSRFKSKSKTAAFSRMRSARMDFGMTTSPCCRLHRIRT